MVPSFSKSLSRCPFICKQQMNVKFNAASKCIDENVASTIFNASTHNFVITNNQISQFHTNAFLLGRRPGKSSRLMTPIPDPSAPSPFRTYPHRPKLSVHQEDVSTLEDPLADPDQKVSIFPPYRKIALKIPALTRGPTNTLEFYVDERMTKPELKMWLENVYNIQGIEKIHTSTHRKKKRTHRIFQRRKIKLSARKKVYVELSHEVDFSTPRVDDLPYFDVDVVEDIARRVPANGDASLAMNWHNRRWLSQENAPSKKLHVHQSRHKFIRKEMNKRLIIQKTLNKIEELRVRVEKIKEQQLQKEQVANTPNVTVTEEMKKIE